MLWDSKIWSSCRELHLQAADVIMLAGSCCIGKLHEGLGIPAQIGDDELVASASADCTVRLWLLNAAAQAAEAILHHADQVMHPALLGPARLVPRFRKS